MVEDRAVEEEVAVELAVDGLDEFVLPGSRESRRDVFDPAAVCPGKPSEGRIGERPREVLARGVVVVFVVAEPRHEFAPVAFVQPGIGRMDPEIERIVVVFAAAGEKGGRGAGEG